MQVEIQNDMLDHTFLANPLAASSLSRKPGPFAIEEK